VLAIQLGLLDDAAQLFRESGRYDLLNRLYQSAGLWDKAISTATAKVQLHFLLGDARGGVIPVLWRLTSSSTARQFAAYTCSIQVKDAHITWSLICSCLQDRIHLKTTHFQYARHLESLGLIDEAIEHYQLSVTANTEVPRMLFQLG
jgi:tetratricopeptide (TPR) repeat protein